MSSFIKKYTQGLEKKDSKVRKKKCGEPEVKDLVR